MARLARPGVLSLLALLVVPACTGPGDGSRPAHRQLTAVWRDYRAMPGERALAIAGELRNGRWVAGASAGHASGTDAEAAALSQCMKQRTERRLQAACQLYAVGDEIVWPTR